MSLYEVQGYTDSESPFYVQFWYIGHPRKAKTDAPMDGSFAIWKLGQVEGARIAWVLPSIVDAWELRWGDDFDEYMSNHVVQNYRPTPKFGYQLCQLPPP